MIPALVLASLTGSIIFIFVFVTDRLTSPFMKASSRRLWWLFLLPAFLCPFDLSVPVPGWPSSGQPGNEGFLPGFEKSIPFPFPAGDPSMPDFFSVSILFLALWLAGALIYLLFVTLQTLRVSSYWSKKRLSTDEALLGLLEDCKALSGTTAPIGLVVSPDIDTPALLGWLRPRILLPEKMSGPGSRSQLRAVFLHELAHFRNLDIPLSWGFTLIRCVHWFNPLAHMAGTHWEYFREEAADETAIGWMQDPRGQEYGQTLIDVLNQNNNRRPVPQGALSIGESLPTLKRRITMINHYPSKRPCKTLALLLAIFVFSGIFISPVPAQSNDPEQAKKEAVQAMETWMKTIDAGKFAQSWKDASAFFKNALTEKQWESACSSVRNPLGKCKERTLASALYQTEVPLPDGKTMKGNYVIAQFISSFENLLQAVETVSFEREADGSWKASGYYIKPKL